MIWRSLALTSDYRGQKLQFHSSEHLAGLLKLVHQRYSQLHHHTFHIGVNLLSEMNLLSLHRPYSGLSPMGQVLNLKLRLREQYKPVEPLNSPKSTVPAELEMVITPKVQVGKEVIVDAVKLSAY